MSYGINFTDVPEIFDSDLELGKVKISGLENPKNLLNQPFNLISGDNYPVLRLLEKPLFEKIDFIYIDPPYNTGKKSFVYNDAFNNDGNNKIEVNDKHSVWLSFMKRRLNCARNLLKQTGCIFISIGQEELFQLKLLCDSIFGEENFINDFMWLCGKGKKDSFSRTMQQSTLCYAKNIKKLSPFVDFEETDWAQKNPDGDKRGKWFSASISFDEKRSSSKHPNFYEIQSPSGVKWNRQWLISKEEMQVLLDENKIYWGKAPDFDNVPRRKVFNGEKNEIIPKNIIDSVQTTREAQNYLDQILDEKCAFDNPKPVDLIKHLISITNMNKDIVVMDFFAGSGTTLQAVNELNLLDDGSRKCILVQKNEKIQKESRFSTISELCLERITKTVGKPCFYELKYL